MSVSGETTGGSWSGLRDRTVQIPGGGRGTPLLLEFRGGFTSGFELVAVRTTSYREHDRLPITRIHHRGPSRVVLPARYDALEIRRVRHRNGAGGFSGWKLRLLDADALPPLPAEETEGKDADTFGYFSPKPYYEYAPLLRWEFVDGPGKLVYSPADGGEQVVRDSFPLNRSGALRLPKHGYVTLSARGKWRVSVA